MSIYVFYTYVLRRANVMNHMLELGGSGENVLIEN